MKKIIIVLVLFLPILVNAQTGLGLWAGASIEKKFNKRFSVQLSGQARLVENLSYTQTYLGELGVSYKITKSLELSGYYRFVNRRKNETKVFKNRHRFYADLAYGKKFGQIKFDYRLRYQHQFKDNNGVNEFDASYFRNKLGVSYSNKTNFEPYVSADFFFNIQDKIFDQIRPKVGVSYKINKKNSIDASIFTNVDLTGTNLATPIIGLTYKLKL